MNGAWLLALLTIVAFIGSVLFLPQIPIGKRFKLKCYPFIPILGAGLMLIFGYVQMEGIISSFTADSSVNPIRILILFLSMTVFSLILEQTGFFEHISGVILQKSGHSQHKIFLALYAVISTLTIFTSNDIVILTFTPFICHFCRAAKIDAIPYLIMEFVAANTWSLLLLIGNPTNIYISGAFEIGFAAYLQTMLFPTIAAGLTSLVIMSLIFRKKLSGEITVKAEISPISDYPLMWVSLLHLGGCVILLAISQYIGFEMWLISLCMAASVILCSIVCLLVRRRGVRCVGRAIGKLPYEIIPFIVGMFVIVLALEENSFVEKTASLFAHDKTVLSFGILSFLSCNVLNNIPMSVLFSKILDVNASSGQIFATIVGSNLGAFITPVGALAGIMWSNLLKQNRVKLSTLRFIAMGILIGVPSVLAALGVLELLT